MFEGEYEKAVSVGRRVVRANPDYVNAYKPLITTLGHLGRREETAPYVEKLLALEPDFTAQKFGKTYPILGKRKTASVTRKGLCSPASPKTSGEAIPAHGWGADAVGRAERAQS